MIRHFGECPLRLLTWHKFSTTALTAAQSLVCKFPVMRLGARVTEYSAGIIKFSSNFLRFGARRYCFTVEEMSVSRLYWIKWLKRVMLLDFDRVFMPLIFLGQILNFLSCGSLHKKGKYFKLWIYRNEIRLENANIGGSIFFIEWFVVQIMLILVDAIPVVAILMQSCIYSVQWVANAIVAS